MTRIPFRALAALALVACFLGLAFAFVSSQDYAAHLDRGVHDLHCSVVPGAAATQDAEPCRAALYSPYSAVMRRSYWGGLPISLAGLGTFAFLAAFAAALLAMGERTPRSLVRCFAWLGAVPLLTSLLMLGISITQLGALCLTCLGIYIASGLLAVVCVLLVMRRQPQGLVAGRTWLALPVALVLLGFSTATPMLVYARSLPDMKPRLEECGTLPAVASPPKSVLKWQGSSGHTAVFMVEDPLCPTCNAFHQRLRGEGIASRLDVALLLFPLDSECNWMLAEPLHPGACEVSRAVLCADDAQAAMDWVFENQERLAASGKLGRSAIRKELEAHFGSKVAACMPSRKTTQQLNQHLHFAAEQHLPISTPQLYVGERRICDEDTDLGLVYTLAQLAPEVLP